MATITRFEDIQAWKMARESTRLIYEASSFASASGSDQTICDFDDVEYCGRIREGGHKGIH